MALACSRPHASLLHTRRSELSSDSIHYARTQCTNAYCRAVRQLVGRATSMVGRPPAGQCSPSSSRALTSVRRMQTQRCIPDPKTAADIQRSI